MTHDGQCDILIFQSQSRIAVGHMTLTNDVPTLFLSIDRITKLPDYGCDVTITFISFKSVKYIAVHTALHH